MDDQSNHSFAQDVAERGARVYHMLHLYDGSDCVNLYHGDGALPPHPVVRNALRNIFDNMQIWRETNETATCIELQRYRVPNLMTIPALHEAILNDFAKFMSSDFDRAKVTVHTGCGVTHLVAALLSHFRKTNADVLMFAPTYTSFLFSASTVGCNVHLVKPTSDGMITPEHIERSLDEHPEVKNIFLLNPNNPTGQYYTKHELEKIARLAFERNLVVISDEIFHKLVYDEKNPFISMASIKVDGKSMLERTITLRSISKDHGLAAVRSGYAIGSKELMEKLSINWFTFGTTFNVDDLAQHVTIAALCYTPDEYYRAQQDLLRRHRDLVIVLIEDINRTAGYEVLSATRPSAGIFQIIDTSGLRGRQYRGKVLDNDIIVYELLLQEEGGRVAFLPASCGGYNASDMKLRLTLSSPESDIKLGMQRLSDFAQKLLRFNQ
jgi:aspartate/methionine/tyrosine aminotransferase